MSVSIFYFISGNLLKPSEKEEGALHFYLFSLLLFCLKRFVYISTGNQNINQVKTTTSTIVLAHVSTVAHQSLLYLDMDRSKHYKKVMKKKQWITDNKFNRKQNVQLKIDARTPWLPLHVITYANQLVAQMCLLKVWTWKNAKRRR